MLNSLNSKFLVSGLFFLAIQMVTTPVICNASEFSRDNRGEVFLEGGYVNGDSSTGRGITLEVESFPAFGIGVGHNFTDHLNINADLLFGSTDVVGSSITYDTTMIMGNFNLDFNILKSRFTPLITGGIGYVRFDVNDDVGETDFSYNIGAGIRWDVGDRFLLKAVYRATWTTMKDADSAILLDNIIVSLGYRF